MNSDCLCSILQQIIKHCLLLNTFNQFLFMAFCVFQCHYETINKEITTVKNRMKDISIQFYTAIFKDCE